MAIGPTIKGPTIVSGQKGRGPDAYHCHVLLDAAAQIDHAGISVVSITRLSTLAFLVCVWLKKCLSPILLEGGCPKKRFFLAEVVCPEDQFLPTILLGSALIRSVFLVVTFQAQCLTEDGGGGAGAALLGSEALPRKILKRRPVTN